MAETPWWITNYQEDNSLFHGGVVDQIGRRQAQHIIEFLKLKPATRILDLAGGAGRVAIPLAKAGMNVSVIDVSGYLIKEGKLEAERDDVSVSWILGDMRKIIGGPYDVVISIFTSFGFFETDDENFGVIKEIRKSLVDDGVFIIDLSNRDYRFAQKTERVWRETSSRDIIIEDHSFDLSSSRWNLTRRLVKNSNAHVAKVLDYSIRLYSPHEIVALCKQAGFHKVSQYSSLAGDALTRDSWRHVTVAC